MKNLTLDFTVLKQAVAAKFGHLAKTGLYRTSVPKDELWACYLGAFPAEANPVYNTRTEHDCTCCKQFIRAVGNAVTVVNGEVESTWDVAIPDEPAYQVVAAALAKLVKSYPIEEPFLHYEPTAGTDKSFMDHVDGVKTFSHFFVNIPKTLQIKKSDLGTKIGEAKTQHSTMLRGLSELKLDAVDAVMELIAQNSLYRGAEHLPALTAFRKALVAFPATGQELYVWQNLNPATAGFRNTVIGTLVTDLSNDVDLEEAVKMFESKVAPLNYKRPTALVTKAQIAKAQATIEELGYTSALERRYATLQDIKVTNTLFVDRNAKKVITGNVFTDLAAEVAEKPKKYDKVEEVSIEKFIADILPTAKTLEVMMQGEHQANLVSLIAPVDPTAANMFKWGNQFSWDYVGGVADSIKMRVKAAGGNVTGELCCRLAWENTDDLDFYMMEPDYSINFRNRTYQSPLGGTLDVDANGVSGMMAHPVENIYYAREPRPSGIMKLCVHNYSQRSSHNPGFDVEIDHKGNVYTFRYDKQVKQSEVIDIAEFSWRDGALQINAILPMTTGSKQVWDVSTNTFQRVSVLMNSPNHWDGEGVGNKHYFLILDGCHREDKARGFFNEFFKPELEPHRRVMELVGSKMSTENSEHQLSGLGFSSTQRNSILARVTGATVRVVKILF